MAYTIKRGDTLSGIAKTNNTDIQTLLKLNPNITNPNFIQAGASLNLPQANPSPVTTPQATPPNYTDIFKQAGAGGVGFEDVAKYVTPPQDETQRLKDDLARQYGYESFDVFTKDVFQKPSKTTEQYYQDAYNAAGLPDIFRKITQGKQQLTEAEGRISENPWLDEASRVGRVKRLNELASGTLGNLIDEYNAKLGEVSALVQRHSQDFSDNQKINEARLNFLLKQAEEKAQSSKTSLLSKYLPDYLSSLKSKKPETVTVGDTLYQWNPDTNSFVQVNNPQAGTLSDYLNFGNPAQRNNNPGNIKVTQYSLNLFKDLGATASSTQATDGGKFLQFPTAEAGFEAMKRLLKSDVYKNLTVEQAMSKWSNKGYGGEITKGINVDPKAFIRDLPADQMQRLIQAMAKQEGYSSGDPQMISIKNGFDALSSRLTKDQRASIEKALTANLQAGDVETARETLRSAAIGSLPAEQQNKAFGRIMAIEQLHRIQTLLDQYKASGGDTSLLKGTEEKIFQKLGKTSDPKIAEIGNEIQTAIISYRNAVSGAAFTESEAKQYENVFPGTKKEYDLNVALIASLKSVFNNNQQTVMSTILGGKSNYDAIFSGGSSTGGDIDSIKTKYGISY